MTGEHTGRTLIRANNPVYGGMEEDFSESRFLLGLKGAAASSFERLRLRVRSLYETPSKRVSLTGREATIATVLKRAGYATGISGKWGLGEHGSGATPNEMGFDEWFGYLNQNHSQFYFTNYLWRDGDRVEIPENNDNGRAVYSNDLMRDFALEFIQRHRDAPFFLFLPFTLPHELLEVPSLSPYADRDWPEEAKLYAAMVTRLDAYVGEIVTKLDLLGLSQSTLVIFTSDNGPLDRSWSEFLASSGGLRAAKGTLYEGGIRVPFIARWPGHVPAGSRNHWPWMFEDVLPTLAQLAGAEVPQGLGGESFLLAATGGSQPPPERALYWEFPKERLLQAGRLGNWKGIRDGVDQPLALYDLATDPGELMDVADENPEIVELMLAHFAREHVPSEYWITH
jgi:arylsulfatase A-like enzyme